mmetsp:Transcript_28259/g.52095  ORF Transcript_28259/g.52095 Transcript_28259/m.52095 type:complete len:147 (-) Transcript_28259:70-510(-)
MSLKKKSKSGVNFEEGLLPIINSENVETVSVKLANGEIEEVQVDPNTGPVIITADGRPDWQIWYPNSVGGRTGHVHTKNQKHWPTMGTTEREIMIHMVAKKNRARRERFSQTGFPPMQDNPYMGWERQFFGGAAGLNFSKELVAGA